jgi:hypothetical protein
MGLQPETWFSFLLPAGPPQAVDAAGIQARFTPSMAIFGIRRLYPAESPAH